MKILVTSLIVIHGLIHVLGFVKAFNLAEISQLTKTITKPYGLLWLACAILFLTTAGLVLLKKEFWPFVGLAGVLISQLLMVVYWKDAKFGTIANLLILVACLPAYGKYQFQSMIQKEVSALKLNILEDNLATVTNEDLVSLPPMVQKWLIHSQIVGTNQVASVHLKQTGQMKTKPQGSWMDFTAEQYFDLTHGSFVWFTKVKAQPLISLWGRDKLIHGQGEMLIKLLALIPVANEKGHTKINEASMQRFLGEISWFPWAALNSNILWDSVDSTSARATLEIEGTQVTGVFRFTPQGQIISFETQRYYGGDNNFQLQTWLIEMLDYKEFQGVIIPYKCKVTWILPEGNFNWLNLEITELEYW